MSQGRLSGLRCVQFLLVAVAIQGITPDAQDLASIHALLVIAPILNDFDSPTQQDEWPDDICDPFQFATDFHLTVRQHHSWPWSFGVAINKSQVQPTSGNLIRCGSPSAVTSHAGLFRSLGRLTC